MMLYRTWHKLSTSKFSALSNITHVKYTFLGQTESLKCGLEFLGWFEHVFFGEYPGTPMHTQGLLALGFLENMHCVVRIHVRRTEHMARGVCANGDQAQVKWAAEFTNLLESWADREIILGVMVVFSFGQLGNTSVSGITVIRSVIAYRCFSV